MADDGSEASDECDRLSLAKSLANMVNWDKTNIHTIESTSSDSPLEELQDMCVCQGRWVEPLAAISPLIRWYDYQHPEDELWLLATKAQLDIQFERRLRIKLFDGELVRTEDLPDDVDVPEYERPVNYLEPDTGDRLEEGGPIDGGEE